MLYIVEPLKKYYQQQILVVSRHPRSDLNKTNYQTTKTKKTNRRTYFAGFKTVSNVLISFAKTIKMSYFV